MRAPVNSWRSAMCNDTTMRKEKVGYEIPTVFIAKKLIFYKVVIPPLYITTEFITKTRCALCSSSSRVPCSHPSPRTRYSDISWVILYPSLPRIINSWSTGSNCEYLPNRRATKSFGGGTKYSGHIIYYPAFIILLLLGTPILEEWPSFT